VPFKKYLLTGLLVWLPLAITVWVMLWLVGLLDGIFAGLLSGWRRSLPGRSEPDDRALAHIPGLGVIAGGAWRLLLHRCAGVQRGGSLVAAPMGPPVYQHSHLQVDLQQRQEGVDTLFSSNGNAFRTAMLVQYPRAGSWTIAFQTGTPGARLRRTWVPTSSVCTCPPRPTRPAASS
jgi:uncharacterized membrane protein